jgi:MFS family permease
LAARVTLWLRGTYKVIDRMSDRPSSFLPLRNRDFRRFWVASQVSTFGGLVQGVAAGWLMTGLTNDPSMIALVQASTSLPILLFSLTAGALADSFDRRHVMLIAQGIMLTVSLGLIWVAWSGGLTPWTLLSFTFLIGVGTALNNPSWQASVGDLVPRDQVPEAVSLNGIGVNLMRSVGPAVGGGIVASFGPAAAFAVNAVSYLPFVVTLLRWKPVRPHQPLPREPFPMAVGAGLRYVAMSPNLLRVLARTFLFGLGGVACLALLPLVARDLMQGGALTYGLLLGSFGVGAIGGGMLNPRLRQWLGTENIVRLSFVGFAAGVAGLSLSRSLWTGLPATAVAGACWVIALSLFNVIVQMSSPRWVVGRALAMYQMATFGGMALGSWVWGLLAGAVGLPLALTTAALCLLLGAALGLPLPLPAFGKADLSPTDQFRAPALQLDLRGRSGPIMVMIDYQIADEDLATFLTVMAERRRIRRRDGARQWVLLRDLEHPEQWTESYHVATWDEYLRHNMRRTKADSDVLGKLHALHRGSEPPRVRRMIERQSVASHRDFPLKDTL